MNSQLNKLGWNSEFQSSIQNTICENFPIARISSVHKTNYRLHNGDNEFKAELSGQLRYGLAPEEAPCVGDFVCYQEFDDMGIIMGIVTAQTHLQRKKVGSESEIQALASNVQKAVIVQAFDRDFNIPRLERMIVQVQDGGISPLVVINKLDLKTDRDAVAEVRERFGDKVVCIATNALTGHGVVELQQLLKDCTAVFIGSSGVGKTSLVNALTGTNIHKTSTLSEATGKGRHTTTSTQLIAWAENSWLIDSPGVREFGLALEHSDSLEGHFEEIDQLSSSCRFSDCKHISEQGCAVLQALDDGSLEEFIYKQFMKLDREMQHFNSSKQERRKKDREFGKHIKRVMASKKKENE